MKSAAVTLLLSSEGDTALWRAALSSQGLSVRGVDARHGEPLHALRAELKLRRADAAIIDTGAFAASAREAPRALAEIRREFAGMRIFLRLAGRAHVSPVEQKWAAEWGVEAILPATSLGAWRETVKDPLGIVMRSLGDRRPDAASLQTFLKVLLNDQAPGEDGAVARHFAHLRWLERIGVEPLRLLAEMRARNGVDVADRSYRGKTYRECFVASRAVDFLERHWGVSGETGVLVGAALQSLGLMHHVVREQPFADGNLFFRFGAGDAIFARVPFAALVEELRGPEGVEIADRSYLGKPFARCFVGREAVDWLRSRCGIALGEAEDLGQRMLELGLLHHVVDEHPFMDGPNFYRFLCDER